MPDTSERDGERIYMISGEDENGDQHVFMTESLERVRAKYVEWETTHHGLRGNDAFAHFVRPRQARGELDDALD